jgi:periplasmic protein TonB
LTRTTVPVNSIGWAFCFFFFFLPPPPPPPPLPPPPDDVVVVGANVAAGLAAATAVPPPPPVPPVAGVVGLSGVGAWATTVGPGAAMSPPRFGLIAVPTTKPKPSASAANVLTVCSGTGSLKPDALAVGGAPTGGA